MCYHLIPNNMKRILLSVVVALALFVAPGSSFAQENFALQQKADHHYYFSTTVAGEQADIMLESGIPALLVERGFYEKSLKNSGLDFKASESQIRLFNNVYKIPFRAEGKIAVGNLVFDGLVFVLDDFSGISMPIQYLKMPDGKKTFIAVDFQEKTMSVSDQKPAVQGEKFKLGIDKELGFPIVSSALEMKTSAGNAKLNGDFVVDLGNPELLFLMQQHKDIEKALQKGNLKLVDLLNPETFEVIATVLVTKNMTLCGRKYEDKNVVVTDKMPAIRQLGLLGVPFFEKAVVFDFAGGEMIVQ